MVLLEGGGGVHQVPSPGGGGSRSVRGGCSGSWGEVVLTNHYSYQLLSRTLIIGRGTCVIAAVLTINQTYNNLGLYDLVADSQILLLNNQSIVQLEVHLLGIKVSHNILISSTQTLAAKTDFLCGRPQARPRGERG